MIEAKAKTEAKQPETKAEAEASRIGLETEARPRSLTSLLILTERKQYNPAVCLSPS